MNYKKMHLLCSAYCTCLCVCVCVCVCMVIVNLNLLKICLFVICHVSVNILCCCITWMRDRAEVHTSWNNPAEPDQFSTHLLQTPFIPNYDPTSHTLSIHSSSHSSIVIICWFGQCLPINIVKPGFYVIFISKICKVVMHRRT